MLSKYTGSVLYRLIAVVLVCLFFLNIFIEDLHALAPAPGTQNPIVRRTAEILEWNLGGYLKFAETEEDQRFLKELNHADALLLSHGKILAAKELKTDPLKLIRKIIHEEIEAILQIMAREDRSKYTNLRDMVLSQNDIRKKYEALFPPGQTPNLPNDLFANDIIARAFELLIPKVDRLMEERELTAQESEFLKAVEPVINTNKHNYFTGIFWSASARRSKIRVAMANGMKFHQVASKRTITEDPITLFKASKNYTFPWHLLTKDQMLLMIKELAKVLGKEPGALNSSDFGKKIPQFGNKSLGSLYTWSYVKFKSDNKRSRHIVKNLKNYLGIKDRSRGIKEGESYYAVLGVSIEATQNMIEKAYHKLAFKFHPDVNHNSDNEKMGEINEAYEVLSDPKERAKYDESLAKGIDALYCINLLEGLNGDAITMNLHHGKRIINLSRVELAELLDCSIDMLPLVLKKINSELTRDGLNTFEIKPESKLEGSQDKTSPLPKPGLRFKGPSAGEMTGAEPNVHMIPPPAEIKAVAKVKQNVHEKPGEEEEKEVLDDAQRSRLKEISGKSFVMPNEHVQDEFETALKESLFRYRERFAADKIEYADEKHLECLADTIAHLHPSLVAVLQAVDNNFTDEEMSVLLTKNAAWFKESQSGHSYELCKKLVLLLKDSKKFKNIYDTPFPQEEYDVRYAIGLRIIKTTLYEKDTGSAALTQIWKFFQSIPENLWYDPSYYTNEKKDESALSHKDEYNGLRGYLQEIGRYKVLTHLGEMVLGLRKNKGDEKARGMLIAHNLRFVVTKAKKYAWLVPLEDLINEGAIGLTEAVDLYNPAFGRKLSKYAKWWIFRSVINAVRSNPRTIWIPQHILELILKYQHALSQAKEDPGNRMMVDDDDEKLEDAAIAEFISTDKKRWTTEDAKAARYALDINKIIELDRPFGNSKNITVGDIIPASDREKTEFLYKNWLEWLLKELRARYSKRDLEMFKLHMLYGIDMPEVAAIVWEKYGGEKRLTRERVRQIVKIYMMKTVYELARKAKKLEEGGKPVVYEQDNLDPELPGPALIAKFLAKVPKNTSPPSRAFSGVVEKQNAEVFKLLEKQMSANTKTKTTPLPKPGLCYKGPSAGEMTGSEPDDHRIPPSTATQPAAGDATIPSEKTATNAKAMADELFKIYYDVLQKMDGVNDLIGTLQDRPVGDIIGFGHMNGAEQISLIMAYINLIQNRVGLEEHQWRAFKDSIELLRSITGQYREVRSDTKRMVKNIIKTTDPANSFTDSKKFHGVRLFDTILENSEISKEFSARMGHVYNTLKHNWPDIRRLFNTLKPHNIDALPEWTEDAPPSVAAQPATGASPGSQPEPSLSAILNIPHFHFFWPGYAGGDPHDKKLLSDKGSGLMMLALEKMPVPPGFVIDSEIKTSEIESITNNLTSLQSAVHLIEDKMKDLSGLDRKFGDAKSPLFLSVRAGYSHVEPGKLQTLLNIGLNDETAKALESVFENVNELYGMYYEFVFLFSEEMLGQNIAQHGDKIFNEAFVKKCRGEGVPMPDNPMFMQKELTAEMYKKMINRLKEYLKNEKGIKFPEDPWQQLALTIKILGKEYHGEGQEENVALTVEPMVFGNQNNNSCTGIVSSRHPITGEDTMYAEVVLKAQGPEVVMPSSGAKIYQTDAFKERFPTQFDAIKSYAKTLEALYKDIRNIEFTIEDGRLYILQQRQSFVHPVAMVHCIIDMLDKNLLTYKEAADKISSAKVATIEALRGSPGESSKKLDATDMIGLFTFYVKAPIVDPDYSGRPVINGFPLCPGVVTGKLVVHSNERGVFLSKYERPILAMNSSFQHSNIDFHSPVGFITERDSLIGHIAEETRRYARAQKMKPSITLLGKAYLAGDDSGILYIDENGSEHKINNGDTITIDGNTGNIYLGVVPSVAPIIPKDPKRQRYLEKAKLLKIALESPIIDNDDAIQADGTDLQQKYTSPHSNTEPIITNAEPIERKGKLRFGPRKKKRTLQDYRELRMVSEEIEADAILNKIPHSSPSDQPAAEARTDLGSQPEVSTKLKSEVRTISAEEVFDRLLVKDDSGEDEKILAARMIDALGIGTQDRVLSVGPGVLSDHIISAAIRGAKVDVVQPEYDDSSYPQTQEFKKDVAFWSKEVAEELKQDLIKGRIDIKSGLVQDVKLPQRAYSLVLLLNVLDSFKDYRYYSYGRRQRTEILNAIFPAMSDKATILVAVAWGPAQIEIEFIRDYALRRGYDFKEGRSFDGEKQVYEIIITRRSVKQASPATAGLSKEWAGFIDSLKTIAESTSEEFSAALSKFNNKVIEYQKKGQSIILYADDMLGSAAVVDLEDAVRNVLVKHDLLNGGKIVLFARKEANAAILEKLIKRAGPDIDIVRLTPDDLGATGDEIKEADAIVRRAKAKGAGEILALIKGEMEDKNTEELTDFAIANKLPIIIVGQEKAAYSFAQALAMAIDAKLSGGSKNGWLIILPSLKELTGDMRREYEESLEVLINA